MKPFGAFLMGVLLMAGVVRAEEAKELVAIDFNRDIRPILSDRCFKCHGPDAKNQRSDFRLDTREHAIADLGGFSGIVPGNLEDSELHHHIRSEDPDEVMPPPKSKMSLSAEEKDLLDRWMSVASPSASSLRFFDAQFVKSRARFNERCIESANQHWSGHRSVKLICSEAAASSSTSSMS